MSMPVPSPRAGSQPTGLGSVLPKLESNEMKWEGRKLGCSEGFYNTGLLWGERVDSVV